MEYILWFAGSLLTQYLALATVFEKLALIHRVPDRPSAKPGFHFSLAAI